MSIGAASSRWKSLSSSIVGLTGHCRRICPLRPGHATGSWEIVEKAVENWLGLCGFRLRCLAFQRVEPRLQRIGLVACRRRHRLHCLELVAADEVEPADPFLRALARRGFGLTTHPRQRTGGAVHEL